MLRQPQPVAASGPVTAPFNGPRNSSYEQAQAQLAARGVIWQRLESAGDTGEWKFSCSIPSRQNPNIRRTYEGRARDALGAIQAVLEQMDKDQN